MLVGVTRPRTTRLARVDERSVRGTRQSSLPSAPEKRGVRTVPKLPEQTANTIPRRPTRRSARRMRAISRRASPRLRWSTKRSSPTA